MVNKSFENLNSFSIIEEQLNLVELEMENQVDGHHPELEVAYKHLLSAGGKRIRPAISLLTGMVLNGDQKWLIKLAAAIELLHTATLVHDDLIDGASIRRGMATLNTQWSPAATVLTGDFVFARAAKLAAETNSVDVMHLFAETLSIIVNGELNQMFSDINKTDLRLYTQRIYAKTASMFELASSAAALLSPVDESIVEQARNFGYNIGMAFQIVDDVLDFTGKEEKVGKPVASDLRQGLLTLPVIYYRDEYPDDPDLTPILNGKYYNDILVNRLVNSINMSNAIQRSLDEAFRYVDAGLQCLKGWPITKEMTALEEISTYIVKRQI